MRGIVFAESVALGFVLTLAIVVRPPAPFVRGRHVRTNYRGARVAGTLGAVLLVALLTGAVVALMDDAPPRIVGAVAGSGLVLGLVGLVDDLYGDRRAGGLVGHARALLHGRVTTGTLKAVAGAIVGIAAAWILGRRGVVVVVGGAVVALGANLVNLLDVRPGRALKVWLPVFALLALAVGFTGGVPTVAALAGGALAFLRADLREQGMLGDTGAAILGGALGAAAVASLGPGGLGWCAGALALLTLAAEVVSFSRVIERVPPLRFVDALGRRTP